MQVAWKRVIDFFYPNQSDEWLTVLRVGLAIEVLLYGLSMRSDWNYLLAVVSSFSDSSAEPLRSLRGFFISVRSKV